MFFFFKQKTAYEMRISDWIQTCALPIYPKSFLFAIVGAEYVLRMLPKGTHRYENFIKTSELSAAARQAGLTLVQMAGMEYNTITELYKISGETSVNYLRSEEHTCELQSLMRI